MIYNIQDTASIPYSELSLNKPMVLQGNHIMKMAVKRDSTSMPFYVQLPECKMIKTATKKRGSSVGACELVFAEDDIASIPVLEFAEKMEERSREMILDNRSWFDTNLESSDIEQFFIPTLKWSRANKNYSWKGINIASNLTIYNDSGERGVELDEVNSETRIICILEIRGIRFSATSFQLEAEIKQILVTRNTPLFEKCLIPTKPPATTTTTTTIDDSPTMDTAKTTMDSSSLDSEITTEQYNPSPPTPSDITETKPEAETKTATEAYAESAKEPNTTDFILDSLDASENVVKDDLEIMDPIIDPIAISSKDPIKLKTRKEVYKQMYEDAILKATNAKRVALLAYLEAKKIKKTYILLENMQNDDSESLNSD
jgi:hypothetical protein